MSFNGSGTFVVNSVGQPVVTASVISSTMFNAFTADIATGLTTCITRDGQSTPTANIPLGGFKHLTGIGVATTLGDALSYGRDATVDDLTAATLTVTTLTFGTVTGILKGTSGVVSAATAGTDYAKPNTASTWTAKQTFSGGAAELSIKISNGLEKFVSSATAATGTVNYDVLTQQALRYSTNAAGNWTLNFRGDGSHSLDSLMAVDESVTIMFAVKQGGTAYYNSAVTIDGNAVTPVWISGAPTGGTINSYALYSYTVQKTASATFFVIASLGIAT